MRIKQGGVEDRALVANLIKKLQFPPILIILCFITAFFILTH